MIKDNQEINTLPIDKVAVQERSVTIRVLTVGTKQVTQTMYRQLVSKSLYFDHHGRVENTVKLWGWVNVHPAGGCYSKDHRHVIYEEYGTLKKALVSELGHNHNWDRVVKTIEDAGQLFIAVSGVWK